MIAERDSDGKEDDTHSNSEDGDEVDEVLDLQLQGGSWGGGECRRHREIRTI